MENHQAELIFDDNDEMIEQTPNFEEAIEDEEKDKESGDDPNKSVVLKKSGGLNTSMSEQGLSRIVHNFGDTDYSQGTKKIDLRKFIGPRSKVEATADFINNII